jgi:HJR/Mrr/RecB family endonuclease
MASRADRIFEILDRAPDKRLRVAEVHSQLASIEGAASLAPAIVPATVRQDNKVRRERGTRVRFNAYSHGDDVDGGDEEHGYVSIAGGVHAASSVKQVLENPTDQLPAIIERANKNVRTQLKLAIADITWQEFEDRFLTNILEVLGFTGVEITQRTRDGGIDAVCSYRRGIVESEVIVSAKHWSVKQTVGVHEVDRMRGIPHDADTAIIITSSVFTRGAKERSTPERGLRSVVLIDGDLIVEACMENSIGVERVDLPYVYRNLPLREAAAP